MNTNPFEHLIGSQEACARWALNESTLRKSLSYGKLVEGVDAKKFGKQWVITLSAMYREYGEPKQQAGE